MADVFLSYAREDRELAERMADAIAQRGWSVWWDRKIHVGRSFGRVIETELSVARCVVVLWSSASIDSDWVLNEADEGARRKILVPIRIGDVRPPLEFRRLHTATLSSADLAGRDFAECLTAIQELVGTPPSSQAAIRAAPSPEPVKRAPSPKQPAHAPHVSRNPTKPVDERPAPHRVAPAQPKKVVKDAVVAASRNARRDRRFGFWSIAFMFVLMTTLIGVFALSRLRGRKVAPSPIIVMPVTPEAADMTVNRTTRRTHIPWPSTDYAADDIYSPQGRRDPFRTLITPTATPLSRPAGIPGFLISELKVQGIFRTQRGLAAMVIAADGKGYMLRTGDAVLDGTVQRVDTDKVTFITSAGAEIVKGLTSGAVSR